MLQVAIEQFAGVLNMIYLYIGEYAMLFFFVIPIPPRSTLFPYTTLFRSDDLTTTQGIAALAAGGVAVLALLGNAARSEEHTSELQSHVNLVCRLLLEKKKARWSRKSRHQARTSSSPRRASTM